jgi:hypothetical protein
MPEPDIPDAWRDFFDRAEKMRRDFEARSPEPEIKEPRPTLWDQILFYREVDKIRRMVKPDRPRSHEVN